MLTRVLLLVIIGLRIADISAVEVPRSSLIIHLGTNRLYMAPAGDTSISHFRVSYPGLYVKLSGESYSSLRNFTHFDLNLSLNRAVMDNGYARISRLVCNYGFGKSYRWLKLSVSPGLCYTTVGYENEANKRSIMENRFAPSLGLQADLVLIKTNYQYLGLFIEGSAMFAKPSRWVHQVGFGISWKPSFRKEPKNPMP